MRLWPFGKSVVAEKQEVQLLEKQEEKTEREEIQIARRAWWSFRQAANSCFLGHSYSEKYGWVAVSKERIPQVRRLLNEAISILKTLRKYETRVIRLGNKLKLDLTHIRRETKGKREGLLSRDEMVIIHFARNIKRGISRIIGKLKDLSKRDFEEIENIGYLQPKNPESGKQIRTEMLEIDGDMRGLEQKLIRLFELQVKVDQKVQAYLNTKV